MRVIEFFYGIGFSGIFLQIVPGIPDYVSYSMIVFGLSTAIVAQWRQAIKDRQQHRDDIKEIKNDFKNALDSHNAVIEGFTRIQSEMYTKLSVFQKQYERDQE